MLTTSLASKQVRKEEIFMAPNSHSREANTQMLRALDKCTHSSEKWQDSARSPKKCVSSNLRRLFVTRQKGQLYVWQENLLMYTGNTQVPTSRPPAPSCAMGVGPQASAKYLLALTIGVTLT